MATGLAFLLDGHPVNPRILKFWSASTKQPVFLISVSCPPRCRWSQRCRNRNSPWKTVFACYYLVPMDHLRGITFRYPGDAWRLDPNFSARARSEVFQAFAIIFHINRLLFRPTRRQDLPPYSSPSCLWIDFWYWFLSRTSDGFALLASSSWYSVTLRFWGTPDTDGAG